MDESTNGLRIEEVAEAFSAVGWKYDRHRDDALELGFGGLRTYRNVDGEPRARVVVDLSDARMKVVAPMAWRLPTGERAAALETCLRLQWRFFGLRFEFDHTDGELRAVVDFYPFALPAASAVPGVIHLLLEIMERVHPAIDAAIHDGVVFEAEVEPDPESPALGELVEELQGLTPEQLQLLLAAVREEVSA